MAAPNRIQTRWLKSINEVPGDAWNALLDDDHPFLRHEFLSALENSGSIRVALGWQVHHLALFRDQELVAAAPCYLKRNSHGEFVFDWHWAQAYERHGLAYYPKLLVGVPYTPVTGPRLLCPNGDERVSLLRVLSSELQSKATELGVSSLHVNFLDQETAPVFAHDPWLPRADWQFHWHNRGYRDLQDFLGELRAKKRKNMLQERARVRAAGIQCRVLHGDEMDGHTIHRIHRFYQQTFAEKGNTPALTESFFGLVAQNMPRQFLAVVAELEGLLIAAAVFFRSQSTLYGRHWGTSNALPGLHFEACYHQGLEYAIAHGLQRFEPGAQGEHKIARGFVPVRTRSAHWIAHPDFRRAIRSAIDDEWQRHRSLEHEYREHLPFHRSEKA